ESDLPPVQPLRHYPGAQAPRAELRDSRGRRGVERLVLGSASLPPEDELGAVRADDEDLGPAVQAEIQPSLPSRPCAQLAVDVADVRAGDDGQMDAGLRQRLDELPQTGLVGGAIGYGRAVPVEHHGFEPARDLRGQGRRQWDGPLGDGHSASFGRRASIKSSTDTTPTGRNARSTVIAWVEPRS